jgi:diadenylate cyclase
MDQLLQLLLGLEISPAALVDIVLTAILIYGVFSLIRGTRAVRLLIGVTVLYAIYVAAQFFGLPLLSQILQTGAVVGLLALVVVFQPELRRALERIGRVGSLSWLVAPASADAAERVAREVAHAAFLLSAERHGALIVIQRDTGLDDEAEKGVPLHADLTAELLRTIFAPRAPLHDGAVIIHGERLIAAGVVFELSESTFHGERFGTRHRAALSITEQTDALAVVISEESGGVSLVERARRLRIGDEERLRTALISLLRPGSRNGRRVFTLPAPERVRRPSGLRAIRRRPPVEPATPPQGPAKPTAGPTKPAATTEQG